MTQVKPGNTVQVHYVGRLQDGTVFDSSQGKEPLQFTLGQQVVVKGVEKALLDMHEGEKKNIVVEPADAYGEYEAGKEISISRDKLQADFDPKPGMMLEIHGQEGAAIAVPIKAVAAETITIDGNHPLAGKTLIFDIELVKIL